MKAMILAAGKGERMRPLTDTIPKPLLQAGGKPLLEHWLLKLEQVPDISEVVINTAYLGDQIEKYVASRVGVPIRLSHEDEPLETGGAIRHAAALLGDEPFLLINGDVFCDVELKEFIQRDVVAGGGHLLLVDNPVHHPKGDFSWDGRHVAVPRVGMSTWTFSGISMISPALVAAHPEGLNFALREPLFAAINAQRVSASVHGGYWLDVGTPERLAQLNAHLITLNDCDR